MFERVVSLELEKAYEELKKLLLRKECKIIAEEHPKSITVEQGSLWEASPKKVKKIISFRLLSQDSKTRIVSTSSLTSDWINISILGYVLAGILAFIFWWLAEALRYTGFQQSILVVSLLKILSIGIAVALIVSIIADIYINARKDSFAKQTLRLLP